MIETMITKHGSYDAWLETMRKIGTKGGKAKVPKGFALMDQNKHIKASKTGGATSRRLI